MITATITVSGAIYPLMQATLRRSSGSAQLDCQIVGKHALSVGDAVVMSVSGYDPINATVTDSSPSDRVTTLSATVAVASGVGTYSPGRIQFRSTGMLRGEIDFDALPGDTCQGVAIREITTTIGASSAWFTEVRF